MPDSQQPGPALDARVAVEVMGIDPCPHNRPMMRGRRACSLVGCRLSIPKDYSTNIAPAWEVLAVVRGWDNHLRQTFCQSLLRQCGRENVIDRPLEWFMLFADAPHAICLAALEAVEGKDNARTNQTRRDPRR